MMTIHFHNSHRELIVFLNKNGRMRFVIDGPSATPGVKFGGNFTIPDRENGRLLNKLSSP